MASSRANYALWALIILALMLYGFQLAHTSGPFTFESTLHEDYIRYLAEHGEIPSANLIPTSHHPPFYYAMGAVLYKLGHFFGMEQPIDTAPYLSLACFALFLFFSIQCLRELLPAPESFLAASLLVLFWPMGPVIAPRVTCDVLLYAMQAATLYASVRWLKTDRLEDLRNVFIAAGLTVLAKNAGIITVGLSGVLGLLAYRTHRQKLWRIDLIAAVLFSLICTYLTYKHGSVFRNIGHVSRCDVAEHAIDFLRFNPLDLFDNHLGLSRNDFWSTVFHTLLLGSNIAWESDSTTMSLHLLAILLFIYIIHGFITLPKLAVWERKVGVFFTAFAALSVMSMMGMYVCIGNTEYADARYIYPVVVIIAWCLGTVIARHHRVGHMRLHYAGIGIAAEFLLLTTLLILQQSAR